MNGLILQLLKYSLLKSANFPTNLVDNSRLFYNNIFGHSLLPMFPNFIQDFKSYILWQFSACSLVEKCLEKCFSKSNNFFQNEEKLKFSQKSLFNCMQLKVNSRGDFDEENVIFWDHKEHLPRVYVIGSKYTVPSCIELKICLLLRSQVQAFHGRNHSVHSGVNPRSKTPPSPRLFCQAPLLKSENCPSLLFRQFLPIYWFLVNPSSKNWIFLWTPMILDFSLFFLCKNCNPLFPRNPPLKMEILSIPSIFENLAGDSTPHPSPPPCPLQAERGCKLCWNSLPQWSENFDICFCIVCYCKIFITEKETEH